MCTLVLLQLVRLSLALLTGRALLPASLGRPDPDFKKGVAYRQLLTTESITFESHDQPMTQRTMSGFRSTGGPYGRKTTRRSCHNSLSAHGRNRVAPSSLPCDHFLIKPCSA